MIIDEPLAEPTVVAIDAVPTAVVRHRGVTLADLRPLFDQGFAAVAASGATLAGPAFALYRGDLSTAFDLDLGFPVTETAAGETTSGVAVEASTLPAGPALALSHRGSYDSLPEGWARLTDEAGRRGLAPKAFLEVYVTEPSPDIDPATLRTDLFLTY